MNTKELQNVLELHRKWLNNEEDGVRAYLRGAYLSEANLSGARLNNCTGNGKEVLSANVWKYGIVVTKDTVCVGCKTYTHEQASKVKYDNVCNELSEEEFKRIKAYVKLMLKQVKEQK